MNNESEEKKVERVPRTPAWQQDAHRYAYVALILLLTRSVQPDFVDRELDQACL